MHFPVPKGSLLSAAPWALGRKLSVYRLPDVDWSHRIVCEHVVTHSGAADLPVHVRVTQADGHQAWSSPIYLIA